MKGMSERPVQRLMVVKRLKERQIKCSWGRGRRGPKWRRMWWESQVHVHELGLFLSLFFFSV